MKKYCIFFFILLVSLSSCGFHPRGILNDKSISYRNFSKLSGKKFYIDNKNYNSLSNEIINNLKVYKALIVSDTNAADYIINIQSIDKECKLTSVVGGASNNIYQLYYRVTYNVSKGKNNTHLIFNNTVDVQQFWQSNSCTQLSQNYEYERIFKYLQINIVPRIITQIAVLLPNISEK